MTRNIQQIYPPLQCNNLKHLKKKVKAGYLSSSNIIHFVGLSVGKKEIGVSTYLSNYEWLFVVKAFNIEVSHTLNTII